MEKSDNSSFPEVIILAGGMGTRLKGTVPDLPKPMAPVGGKPFLFHLLTFLKSFQPPKIILSVSYKHEIISEFFGDTFGGIKIEYAVEKEPLGTGGAILLASEKVLGETFMVLNGDTFFNVDLRDFFSFYKKENKAIGIAVKKLIKPDRYGTVTIENRSVLSFNEKEVGIESGYINGGIYCLNKSVFSDFNSGMNFSMEKEILEPKALAGNISGFKSPGYFIDIGIPEDYFKADKKFKAIHPDKTWTLFLDRDGVINKKIDNDYVKTPDEFEFLPGALTALKGFSEIFGRIVVVTNQQGVGKGMMTKGDLDVIHAKMMETIEKTGGRIDQIFYCPSLASENDPCRKPGTGMALEAKGCFPEIDFSKSVLIGDSKSDLEMGSSLGFVNIYISSPSRNDDFKYLYHEKHENLKDYFNFLVSD